MSNHHSIRHGHVQGENNACFKGNFYSTAHSGRSFAERTNRWPNQTRAKAHAFSVSASHNPYRTFLRANYAARLESLPPQASSKALRWLQDFSFPEADLDTIEVDDEGGVFYGDTLLPDPEPVEAGESAGPTLPAEAPVATLDDAFLLHSRPGSSNVVYIDFDGTIISGTAWNGTLFATRCPSIQRGRRREHLLHPGKNANRGYLAPGSRRPGALRY